MPTRIFLVYVFGLCSLTWVKIILKIHDCYYNITLGMRLVILTVLVISLATIVIKAEGSRLIIEEKSRMLQK